jgi:hypothetical protein
MPETHRLSPRSTSGGSVTATANGWRLSIPGGKKGMYRLAQLDDYGRLARTHFPWHPPMTLSLRARLSAADLPGTWGFGLWNDPFGMSLGFGGTAGRLPALPEVAWFFHASPENHLALRDGLPGQGFFAGSMHSPGIPSLVLTPALLALPLLPVRPIARLLRRLAARIIRQEANAISVDVKQWHLYSFIWLREGLNFAVDDQTILESRQTLLAPLALVLWIDNQYAAWAPDGHIGYGTLSNPASWLELSDLKIEKL